jgi:hypothetical protein
MAQIAFWGNAIANQLFEFLHLRESFLLRTRPHDVFSDPYFKDATGAWLKTDLSDFVLKCGQQLLGSPAGSEKPATLCAIFNLNPRKTFIHLPKSISPLSARDDAKLRKSRSGMTQNRLP